jgi:hypothetical protein
MNARRSPGWVGLVHRLDELDQLGGQRGTPGWPGAALPAPVAAEAAPMPADHRLGLDQNQRVPPAGPDAGQRHPEQTVGGPQLHPAPPMLSLEDQ